MAEAQIRTVKGLLGTEYCVVRGFVSKRVDIDELRGRWVRIVCIDDTTAVLETEDGRLYELEAIADCTYSDCSDPEDPYGILEIYRLYPR